MLGERIGPKMCVVLLTTDAVCDVCPDVVCAVIVLRADGCIVLAADIMSAIEMVIGRHSQQRSGTCRVDPGEIRKCIGGIFDIAYPEFLLLGNIRYLIVVSTRRAYESKLILWREIKDQRSKSRKAGPEVVKDFEIWSLKPQVSAVATGAAEICKPIGMAAEAQVFIGLMKAPVRRYKFTKTVCFEPGSRNHVKHAIAAI